MKYRHGAAKDVTAWPSLPARGAWIEMTAEACIHTNRNYSRSPHGERGLKCETCEACCGALSASLPARGAWIEMYLDAFGSIESKSLPARGAWIEMPEDATGSIASWSLPARGAWIEIHFALTIT